MTTDKPNPPKAAPTHQAMNELVRNAALYVLDGERLTQALRYIAASETKDARIAELEHECREHKAVRSIKAERIAELEREVDRGEQRGLERAIEALRCSTELTRIERDVAIAQFESLRAAPPVEPVRRVDEADGAHVGALVDRLDALCLAAQRTKPPMSDKYEAWELFHNAVDDAWPILAATIREAVRAKREAKP